MPITTQSNRQYALVGIAEFVEADFDATATPYAAVELPAGAIVTGGYIAIETLFDGGAAQTLTVSGGGVSTSAIDADATGGSVGVTALTLTGVEQSAGDTVDVAMGGATGGTAGVGKLVVEYVLSGRSNENFDA